MDISDFSQTMSLSFLETLLRNNSLDSTLMISETIIKGLTDTLCCIKTANNLTDIELKHVFCPSICLAEVQLMCTGLRYSSLLFLKCRFALDLIHVSLIFFLETADWSIFVRAEIRSFQRSWSFWLKKIKKKPPRLEHFTFHFCLFLSAEENPHGQAAHLWGKWCPLCALNWT